jgi:hypothetical protein
VRGATCTCIYMHVGGCAYIFYKTADPPVLFSSGRPPDQVYAFLPFAKMGTQECSYLFSLATEIRWAIYFYFQPNAIHVWLRNGQVAISPYVEPSMAGVLDGLERRGHDCDLLSSTKSATCPIWVRRLLSSWGPHWQCEEVATYGHGVSCQNTSHNSAISTTLSVCKRMSVGVVLFGSMSISTF